MTTQTRVLDAARIETDELGMYAETENDMRRRVRVGIPGRFGDTIAEAKKMARPIRLYYAQDQGVAVAELVELV